MATEIELYEIATDLETYRYTSYSEDVERGGQTYTAAAIRREALVQTDDLNRASLSIRAAYTLPYVTAARVRPLAAVVTLLGYDLEDELWLTLWKGRVTAVVDQGREVEIVAESLATEARRPGLFAKYQLLCRHVLFGEGCGVDPGAFSYAGNVSAISGLSVTVPGLDGAADGFYTGGYVLFESGDYRMITSHAANTVAIYTTSPGLEVGHTANVFAGCNHTRQVCADTFNNLLNFGGFPWMPIEGGNPFDTAYSALPLRSRVRR